jgi:D-alanyl-lipoteichoic acid acyltransferase DltB (MBOAT superfamily)
MISHLAYALMYLVCAFLALRVTDVARRGALFALANIFGSYLLFFSAAGAQGVVQLVTYLAWCAVLYAVLRAFAGKRSSGRGYAVAVAAPVAWLVGVKLGFLPAWIGVSYMAFRLSYLAYEMQVRGVALPSFSNYMGFAFFPATLLIGPISPYSLYERSLAERDSEYGDINRALGRILVGIVKVLFLGALCKTLSFSVLWRDGYTHGVVDFVVSCVASYLYLYLNFSGGCDIIIGAAALLNIRVLENFNAPLMARNIQDFWKRFHISLYRYLNDVVFAPLSVMLARLTGPASASHATALALLCTMLLVGLWHGITWNFALLGVLHGVGMVVFYYTSLAVRRLPKTTRELIASHRLIRVASTALTFAYVSLTMVLFENDPERLLRLWRVFRW